MSPDRVSPDRNVSAPPPRAPVAFPAATLVEHYPRLVRIAHLVLPPSPDDDRRVLAAHGLVQRALPTGRTDPGYASLRERVLRLALDAGRPRRWPGRALRSARAALPVSRPYVRGLRLVPRSGGAAELALDQRLSALSGPARAALVLRALEGLPDAEVRRTLAAAGAGDPDAALAEAAGIEPYTPGPTGPDAPGSPAGADASGGPSGAGGAAGIAALLLSPGFDACSLRARPTDLLRRRRRGRAALAATVAAVFCGALLALPGDGWGPGGAGGAAYARHPAGDAALDPAAVLRAAPAGWLTSTRTDFSVWPARGPLAGDDALLGRALTVWAAPGGSVRISTTPATPSGPPMGSPQLLYAGEVDGARVVVFHDGLRIVRYAESAGAPATTSPAGAAPVPVSLDFARTDGADAAASGALAVGRSDGDVRYLTAPWVSGTAVRDLRAPDAPARPLRRDADGVTDPVPSPVAADDCASWETLEAHGADDGPGLLLTDLGEPVPARLTSGPPGAPRDVREPADRAAWARTACLLSGMRSRGVRSVNSWEFARQPLPDSGGTARWLCTRAETWRGPGSTVLAQFQAPSSEAAEPGTVAAEAEDSPACGAREPRALAGVVWRSGGGRWYVLAAGSEQFRSLATTGDAPGAARGNLLAVPASRGAGAELSGRLSDGTEVGALR
ncbi:hypothetical protein [Streptomyces sp. NPDC088258]|uniref:hypothetical protein n=1 Tax=Streptomyces sp. NPDC088258 TaxID=3365849 RepID=UPI003821D310